MVNTNISVQEPTDVSEVRRAALDCAELLSFNPTQAGNVGLVVTEAARNILKHAGGGQVLLRCLEQGESLGVEMLALDKGPGIADLGRCFEDGYSTAGTPGTGLGAINRLSTVCEIYSRSGQGTALLAQIWRQGNGWHKPSPRFRVGGVCVPMPGEEDCGDAWIDQQPSATARLTVADGLGHGPAAADAARAAIRTARENENDPGPSLLERIHGALRATRGAAVAVAEIDSPAQLLRFTGVGNIAAVVVPEHGSPRRLVSLAGTAGHEVRKISEFSYPWNSQSVLVMHSDGLQTQWSFDPYPGLRERHPSLIAGVLYRDYVRGRDDATVVVAREAQPLP